MYTIVSKHCLRCPCPGCTLKAVKLFYTPTLSRLGSLTMNLLQDKHQGMVGCYLSKIVAFTAVMARLPLVLDELRNLTLPTDIARQHEVAALERLSLQG